MDAVIASMRGRIRGWVPLVLLALVSLAAPAAGLASPLPDTPPPEGAAATALALGAGKQTVNHGKPAHLAMRLTSGEVPLAGRTVSIYRGSDTSGWRRVAAAKTGRAGRAAVGVTLGQNETFVAVFEASGPDAARYASAASAEVAVKLRPRMELDVPSHVLPNRSVALRGTIAPPAAREGEILATIRRGGRKPLVRRVDVRSSGRFAVDLEAREGRVSVQLTHAGSERFAPARPVLRRSRAGFPARLREGSRGPAVLELQRMLRERGYLAPRSGRFDRSTAWAVKTAHREMRIGESKAAGRSLWRRLVAGRGYFRPRYSKTDRHVEADLSRQVVAFIDHGRPEMVMPTSSGAPSTPTVLGTYSFYSRQPGINSLRMLHSVYFIRGYAIHGYPSVPDYPASHGCLRLPNWWARTAYDWVELGMKIHVYR